jgi:signal transduction histidine kinase
LRALFVNITSALEVKNVAQGIVDAYVKELAIPTAFVMLVDNQNNVIRPYAVAHSDSTISLSRLFGKPFLDVALPLDYQSNLIIRVLADAKEQETGNILDIFTPEITQEVADRIGKLCNIRTVVVLPLTVGTRSLGALCIGASFLDADFATVKRDIIRELGQVVSVVLDRAILYEDLHRANDKLQELDKLKDEFVTLASHELRTPMAAIRGSLSTILEGYAGDIPQEAREFLAAAYNENDRLIRLVNNLLNISRIEAGRLTFHQTKVNLDLLITEVVSNLQMAAKEKYLSLVYQSAGIPMVAADADKVREVLVNLIGNAIKYTHKGGVTIVTESKENSVVTSVTDTGSGIAKEDQDLLFKKFSQVRGSYARPTGGTGLGLYICKQIIEGLKGKIWLESTLGKGSSFYFALPIVTAENP